AEEDGTHGSPTGQARRGHRGRSTGCPGTAADGSQGVEARPPPASAEREDRSRPDTGGPEAQQTEPERTRTHEPHDLMGCADAVCVDQCPRPEAYDDGDG